MRSCDVKLNFLVCFPSVIFDIINFTSFELYFLNVFVATESVDFSSTHTNGREKRLLLDHRCTMNYVLVDVLQAIVTHASDQEP